MCNSNGVADIIGDDRISSWVERFEGYRVAVTDDRVKQWLGLFGDDNGLGAKVLDNVLYLKSEDMEELLRTISARLPGWDKNQAKRIGVWRFVPFSGSAGKSGDTMTHKFRIALKLTGHQYDELFIYRSDLVRAGLGPEDSVVFLDDFAGTGDQACKAWTEWFSELLPDSPNIYLALIAAGEQAVTRINQETDLNVIADRLLCTSDNVFSDDCLIFTKTEKKRLLDYCNIANQSEPRGYGECGFLFVLSHKTPNNSIPILHVNHPMWEGLFPRN